MSTLRMTAEAKVRSNPMCIITWLVPRAGKMKRILCSDWLPERGRWVYRACSGFPALVPQEKSSLCHIINRSIIDQNYRGRQYPTHMSFLARSTSLSAGYNATMRLRSHCFESCTGRAYGSWRNLGDVRENKYTCTRITGEIRQAGVKLLGAASMFRKTAKIRRRYETS